MDLDSSNGPQKISDITKFLWLEGNNKLNTDHYRATDSLLDIIAKSRNYRSVDRYGNISYETEGEGSPLMPIRSHIFIRGLPKLFNLYKMW